jgi:hypothetical protein
MSVARIELKMPWEGHDTGREGRKIGGLALQAAVEAQWQPPEGRYKLEQSNGIVAGKGVRD